MKYVTDAFVSLDFDDSPTVSVQTITPELLARVTELQRAIDTALASEIAVSSPVEVQWLGSDDHKCGDAMLHVSKRKFWFSAPVKGTDYTAVSTKTTTTAIRNALNAGTEVLFADEEIEEWYKEIA